MIGDPSGTIGRAEPARPRARSPRTRPRSRPSSSTSSTSARPGSQAAVVEQLDWLGRYRHARVPARRRQALHDPVHAGQGLGPAPARRRPVVHRVQLHAPPGGRLPAPVPELGVELQMGGADQWGNITAGLELDPPGRDGAGERAEPRPRACRTRSCSPRTGSKFGKTAEGDVGLARPGPDLAVRLLPVLARRRRSRRRPALRLLHAARPADDRGARGRRGGRAPSGGSSSVPSRATSRPGSTAARSPSASRRSARPSSAGACPSSVRRRSRSPSSSSRTRSSDPRTSRPDRSR